MKRILALVVSVTPLLAFVWGWFFGRRRTSSPLVPPSDTPTVIPPPSFWERHKLVVDPYVLLIVTLISVVLSGLFAGLTWKVNSTQADLLERQTEIQASQVLPRFSITRSQQQDMNGTVVSETLTLQNNGGLARNARANIYTWVQFGWEPDGPSGFAIFGRGVPFRGYFSPQGSSSVLYEEGVVFGAENNRKHLEEQAGLITQKLEQDFGTGEVRYYIDIVLHVEYTDYMGTDRDEWYIVVDHIDPEEVYELLPTGIDEGEFMLRQFTADYRSGYEMGSLREPTNDSEMTEVARRIFEEDRPDCRNNDPLCE